MKDLESPATDPTTTQLDLMFTVGTEYLTIDPESIYFDFPTQLYNVYTFRPKTLYIPIEHGEPCQTPLQSPIVAIIHVR